MADVFISYKREDSRRIEGIVRLLRDAGHSVWWDQGIEPGDEWFSRILDELDASEVTIGVWSRASIDARGIFSPNDQGKYYVKIEHDRTRRGRLIPLLIDEGRVALEFGHLQAANFVDWAGDVTDPRCRQLLARVGQFSKRAEPTAAVETGRSALASSRDTGDNFLDGLRAQNRDPLGRRDFESAAQKLGCSWEAVAAAVEVESGRLGAFAADGRPIIIFEPHIFSRRTKRVFDRSHPAISYPTWDASKYPRTQDERWNQLKAAYALDPQNAVASASYGLFQIMGFNHAACGFADPKSFVTDMSKSQAQQLKAFTAFVRANNLADELVRKDWEGFARGYNGSGQVERYGGMMRDAYARLKAAAPPTS